MVLFQGERRGNQSSLIEYKAGDYRELTANKGGRVSLVYFRALGGSGKFYCNTTKPFRSPFPGGK